MFAQDLVEKKYNSTQWSSFLSHLNLRSTELSTCGDTVANIWLLTEL